MATKDSTLRPAPALTAVRTCEPHPRIDAANALDCKLAQLRSLLTSMYGVGQAGFEAIGTRHRDNLIWLAADLAQEVDELRGVARG